MAFLELRLGEVRRTSIPRNRVNRGKRKAGDTYVGAPAFANQLGDSRSLIRVPLLTVLYSVQSLIVGYIVTITGAAVDNLPRHLDLAVCPLGGVYPIAAALAINPVHAAVGPPRVDIVVTVAAVDHVVACVVVVGGATTPAPQTILAVTAVYEVSASVAVDVIDGSEAPYGILTRSGSNPIRLTGTLDRVRSAGTVAVEVTILVPPLGQLMLAASAMPLIKSTVEAIATNSRTVFLIITFPQWARGRKVVDPCPLCN